MLEFEKDMKYLSKVLLQFRLRSIFFAFLWGFSEKERSALEGHKTFRATSSPNKPVLRHDNSTTPPP
jgi:hypothetical protein